MALSRTQTKGADQRRRVQYNPSGLAAPLNSVKKELKDLRVSIGLFDSISAPTKNVRGGIGIPGKMPANFFDLLEKNIETVRLSLRTPLGRRVQKAFGIFVSMHIANNFLRQKDKRGTPWKDLAPATIRKRKKNASSRTPEAMAQKEQFRKKPKLKERQDPKYLDLLYGRGRQSEAASPFVSGKKTKYGVFKQNLGAAKRAGRENPDGVLGDYADIKLPSRVGEKGKRRNQAGELETYSTRAQPLIDTGELGSVLFGGARGKGFGAISSSIGSKEIKADNAPYELLVSPTGEMVIQPKPASKLKSNRGRLTNEDLVRIHNRPSNNLLASGPKKKTMIPGREFLYVPSSAKDLIQKVYIALALSGSKDTVKVKNEQKYVHISLEKAGQAVSALKDSGGLINQLLQMGYDESDYAILDPLVLSFIDETKSMQSAANRAFTFSKNRMV